MGDDAIRRQVEDLPVPVFETTAITPAPPLSEATVAIVTTAGLRREAQQGWSDQEASFRELSRGERDLKLSHRSSNFDRSGLASDLNIVYPIDRLEELASAGTIGSVSDVHLSFMGALRSLTTIRLDSGPGAAEVLLRHGVDVVVLTPV